ncbi:unnamed protein product, partial [Rotaria magnacalcarata]
MVNHLMFEIKRGFYIICPSINLVLFPNLQVQHRIATTIRIEALDHRPL